MGLLSVSLVLMANLTPNRTTSRHGLGDVELRALSCRTGRTADGFVPPGPFGRQVQKYFVNFARLRWEKVCLILQVTEIHRKEAVIEMMSC